MLSSGVSARHHGSRPLLMPEAAIGTQPTTSKQRSSLAALGAALSVLAVACLVYRLQRTASTGGSLGGPAYSSTSTPEDSLLVRLRCLPAAAGRAWLQRPQPGALQVPGNRTSFPASCGLAGRVRDCGASC